MNVSKLLWDAAQPDHRRALPILSFPAAQKLGVTVEQLVKDASLQADTMALIAAETDTLAAVSLMDLSVEAEAFGAKVQYFTDEVPAVVGQLVSDMDEAEELEVPDLTKGRAATCVEGIRMAKERIADKPVLAGMIGPYSLAGRLMDVTEIMILCYEEPEMVHTVMEKATAFLIDYCRAYEAAGANGVVIAEPLTGLLSPSLAREFSHPYVCRIIEAVQNDNFAVIYHNCGDNVPLMAEDIYRLDAMGYHFGDAISMADMLPGAPADVLVMGNVSPSAQFCNGTPASIREATLDVMNACCSYPNFLISSGCDIPPVSSWDNIDAFFAAAEGFYRQ